VRVTHTVTRIRNDHLGREIWRKTKPFARAFEARTIVRGCAHEAPWISLEPHRSRRGGVTWKIHVNRHKAGTFFSSCAVRVNLTRRFVRDHVPWGPIANRLSSCPCSGLSGLLKSLALSRCDVAASAIIVIGNTNQMLEIASSDLSSVHETVYFGLFKPRLNANAIATRSHA